MLEYLLTQKTEKAIFVDCDISFYGDFSFLFKDLDEYDILLTQHWRTIDPEKNMVLYKSWFDYGLYNAGFIAVNKNSIKMLKWWGSACLSICGGLETRYYFSDQFHLNLVPLFFEKTKVLNHLGCNTGLWTLFEHKITEQNEEVFIDQKDPLIFFHYTHIKQLKKQSLPTKKLISDFLNALETYGFDTSIYNEVENNQLKKLDSPPMKETSLKRKLIRGLKKIHSKIIPK
jgi:lipopolysaccharide biosynthesis glycosyltransferase